MDRLLAARRAEHVLAHFVQADAADLLFVFVGALVLRWRRPALIIPAMLLAWLVLWLPTSNVLALPNPRADRYAYLPSVPICIALGSLFEVALARTHCASILVLEQMDVFNVAPRWLVVSRAAIGEWQKTVARRQRAPSPSSLISPGWPPISAWPRWGWSRPRRRLIRV